MNTVDITSIHSNLSKKYQTEDSKFYYYLMRAIPILERSKDMHKSKSKIQFMGATQPDTGYQERIQMITREYLKLVEEYYPNDFRENEWDKIKVGEVTKTSMSSPPHRSGTRIKCLACNNENDNFCIYDNHFVCEKCGLVSDNTHNHISYKDIDRVNISSKYTYDRRTHFRDCINQFQGKQNASIDAQVYTDLIQQFILHDLVPANYIEMAKEIAFSKITKEHIMLFLKETRHSKHYEDVVLIYTTLTNKPAPDISHLENSLLQDFDTLTDLYDKRYKNTTDRKNFINTQYVLYQLLRRHKYPCKKEDFNILKTVDRKYYHDTICTELFQQLGWNLHPLF